MPGDHPEQLADEPVGGMGDKVDPATGSADADESVTVNRASALQPIR